MIQGGRSGVGRYVIALAEELQRSSDIDLYIAGLADDRVHFPFTDIEHWLTIPSWAARGPANLIWHQVMLPGLLRKGGYDILHIPSYRRMLARCPIPQVATIHDCAPFVLKNKYDFFRSFFGTRIVPAIARGVDRILAVSQTTADDIAHYMQVDPAKITVTPNGIDHERFCPPSQERLRAFKEKHRLARPYLVYISRLEHPAKNHVRLMEAFARFRKESGCDWELILGGAPWHGHEVIEQAHRESPCREHIRMAGFIDEGELPCWYAASQALVFPSLMEGFGFPVIEAQACGTLAAVADATSLREVAGPAAVRFDPLSIESMTEALLELSRIPARERETRLEAARAWADQYRWSHVATACETVYRELSS